MHRRKRDSIGRETHPAHALHSSRIRLVAWSRYVEVSVELNCSQMRLKMASHHD
jgi:hypothetical protein